MAAGWAAGCAGEGGDALRTDAEAAATAADATADAAEVSAWFGEDTGTTEAAIAAAIEVPACVTVDTDGATWVEATFDACTGAGGRGALDGTVRGELSIATEPCGPGQCPVAAVWTITAALDTGAGGALDGAWTVTVPLDGDAARTLAGEVTAIGPWGRTVTATIDASWRADAAGCVTVDADAAVDADAGAAALAVDGLARCPDACPTAGAVTLALPRGDVAWTYDGDDTVTVSGPRGTIDLPLHCGS